MGSEAVADYHSVAIHELLFSYIPIVFYLSDTVNYIFFINQLGVD